jgi:hypothetical protein
MPQAQNYSILICPGGSANAAPLHDLICAAVYRTIDHNLPQSMSARFTAPDLRRRDWQVVTRQIELNSGANVRRVEELGAAVGGEGGSCDAKVETAGDPRSSGAATLLTAQHFVVLSSCKTTLQCALFDQDLGKIKCLLGMGE